MRTIIASAWRQLLCLALLLLSGSAPGADDLQQAEEAAFKAATATVAPSVVRIETFGGQEKIGNVLVGAGPTTGLIVSDDGYILSSAFNFAQKPSSILVTLPGGKRAAAQIVARDHSRMLVLLKVATSDKLPVPTAVPREEMSVGQWTVAVGRTFDQAEPNLSLGVLSAKQRIWGKAIQCDAKISPSNYGGPLIDLRGHVLGLLVPMSPQGEGETAGAEWYDSGIGFAVPLAELMPRLEKLKQGQDLFAGLLGISLKGNDLYNAPATIVACQPNG
ncbi:MAG TPA: S1C family serine protease, partial [Pirellulaceae bacterium]|nr:S1C family serine protease [Pirellulaceae bacterium]